MVSRNAKIATAIIVGGALASATIILLKRKTYAGGFTGTMTIHVENANTLTPIAGANITYAISGANFVQTTDASGNATFTNVPAGTGNLTVVASGYTTYGPVSFTPTGPGPYFVPLVPTGGGIVYSQSLLFVTSTQAAGIATVTYTDQNTISIDVVVYCTVKNAAGQTVGVGQSTPQVLAAGATAVFSIPFSPALPPGSYIFNFFATDTLGRPVSVSTPVTATV